MEQNSGLIATNSGGVQKRGFRYKVRCVTFRDETERVKLVESAWNEVAPPESAEAICGGILDGFN